MASTVVATRGLDLSARAIDLLAGPLTTSIINWSVDIYEWLAREGVDRDSLSTTMELAKDFALPNRTGLELLEEQIMPVSQKFGLKLVVSRSLGRTVFSNVHVKWMAMTEAVLMSHHGLDYVVHLLTQIILTKVDQRMRTVFETRIHPVLTKMVESIALHLRSFPQPPEELAQLAKHYMAADYLALAISAIQQHDLDDLVVCTNYCPIDLLMWILYHWDGTIEVSY
ncbi:hypothetical protein BT69DRAFT_1230843, partial [Atractiella rhizophila]